MKKLKKRVFLGLGVLMAAYILFVVYDYLDNQKKEEQSRAFMEESNKAINEYDIISLGVNPNNKTIKVHVPIKEKRGMNSPILWLKSPKSMAWRIMKS